MFEEYICWGKKTVDAKTASNSAAESRIEMLKQYIADVDAGRVEFTSERQDLEKEIEELTGDLELAKNMRAQETKDYEVAKEEMTKATTALTSAIDVLEKATQEKKSALVAVKTAVHQGFAERAAEGASLNLAVNLGEKFLTKGDALFLRRLLTAEVPTPDWKKLNRKATFKMSYKARSGNIQSVLKKLLSTFQANLNDATAKEEASQKSYETLKGTKDGQLTAAQESLTKMESEMGARGMSKADATKEVGDLETQVTNDKTFIGETQTAMATKTTEWKARSQLRAGELKAISEAVAILSSDDAKDNFKKSLASQGFLFLQTSQKSKLVARASQQIQQLAQRTRDMQLMTLLANVQAGRFDAVVTAIDKMVASLKEAETADLTNKEDCEKTRMEDVRDAVLGGRAMDDLTDSITSLMQQIKDLNAELEKTKAELKKAQEEMAEATKLRNAEKAEWLTSDGEDKEASETVGQAMAVLEKFYKDNNLVFAQKQSVVQAPLPPPATWEGDYKGKTGENAGIIGILKLCQEDMDKDRASAKASEDEAQTAYDKIKEAFEAQEAVLNTAIGDLSGQIGDKESAKVADETSRKTKSGELDATMKKIKNADAGCEYIEVNYPIRVQNRQIEIDGLLKAKAILQGADFAKPADANRAIKPGDALLQRLRRH